jgi:radical SAM protein with 4Fe4S-binding SPASM domain
MINQLDSRKRVAPWRMDLALTYRCNQRCSFCYVGDSRCGIQEMSTGEWKDAIKKLREAGVLSLVFTGGEPTMREDLVEIAGSSSNKFVKNIVTNGIRLAELAGPLREAGVMYATVSLQSHIPEIHNRMTNPLKKIDAFSAVVSGIEACLEAGIHVTINTILTKRNAQFFPGLIRFVKGLGVKSIACNHIMPYGRGELENCLNGLSTDELKAAISYAKAVANEIGVNLKWIPAICRAELNPAEFGFRPKRCGAADKKMTVQPDGTVIPCENWPETVGHILRDSWKNIWEHSICTDIRSKRWVAENKPECMKCEFFEQCGGGCMLSEQVVLPKVIAV